MRCHICGCQGSHVLGPVSGRQQARNSVAMDRELLISQGTLRLKTLPIEYPTTRQYQLVSGRTIGETRLIVHSRFCSKGTQDIPEFWEVDGTLAYQSNQMREDQLTSKINIHACKLTTIFIKSVQADASKAWTEHTDSLLAVS